MSIPEPESPPTEFVDDGEALSGPRFHRVELPPLLAGLVADAAGAGTAIAIVAVLTGVNGLVVAATPWHSTTTVRP